MNVRLIGRILGNAICIGMLFYCELAVAQDDSASAKGEKRLSLNNGILMYQAGLTDSSTAIHKELQSFVARSDLIDSTFLRPRQQLWFDQSSFGQYYDGCNYPVAEYFFYAGKGSININVAPASMDQDLHIYLRTNGPYPTPGSIVPDLNS